ncbi:MAG: hypothetical protein IJT04_09180 [Bacteroidales bacterium]|nr:hypothetical protein [Bacteroidales bacterium]
MMKKMLTWLHWLMILPFGLFLYIGVKGCIYLLMIRYEESGSLIPLVVYFLIDSIIGIALILVFSYVTAPKSKMASVVGVAFFCIAFNGYFEVWRAFKNMTETPLWQAGMLTGLSVITSITVWNELRNYHKHKLNQNTKTESLEES